MKRHYTAFFLATLLVACGGEDGAGLEPNNEPAVAISQIDGPLVGGRAGALVDAVDARRPRAGALVVAAAQQYDPVGGQTTDNPISVYVTASDELGLDTVELSLDGTSMGTYLESSDGQVFKNPFIFPAPRSSYLSVPIPGSPSGLVASQLRARATDASGQLAEEAVLELQADGSRPDLSLSALGDGPPFIGPVTLNAQAADPETGIRSFAAFLNGEAVEINPATPTTFSLTQDLEPGTQTVRLVATNGVFVPNEAIFSFVVAEDPEDSEDGEGEGNQEPTVSLLAAPTEGEPPLAVSFTASATDPDGDEVTYLYDFGDGVTTAGAPAASHTYTEAGTYTATVTVDDGKGGTGSSTVTITVGDGGDDGGDDGGGGGDDGGDDGGDGGDDGGGDDGDDGSDNQAPEVSLTAEPDEGTAPLTVDFTAVASDPDNDELSYVWNFGDGERASGETARTHTYSAAGSYTAFVVVTDGSGGKARAEVVVEVGGDGDDGGDGGDGDDNQPPVVTLTATPTAGGAPLEVTFTAEASDPDGDALEYVWNFGDNENATGGTTQTHTYTAADTYVASVTVTDGQGGKAIVEVTITVN